MRDGARKVVRTSRLQRLVYAMRLKFLEDVGALELDVKDERRVHPHMRVERLEQQLAEKEAIIQGLQKVGG